MTSRSTPPTARPSPSPISPSPPRPRCARPCWSRSDSSTGTAASTRRSARSSWPGTAAACRRSTWPATTAAFEARHLAATGRRAIPARAARRDSRAPSPAGSTATAVSASRSTCAATARSSRTSGARRSRSRAARSGRTAGSPPRSADRGRCARSARRSATTRCRSSCPCHRVVRTDGIDRPVLAGRAREQADDPGRRGPRPGRDGGRREARRAARRLRLDAHRVLADLPHRAPHAGAQSAAVPVAGRGGRGRLPAVQGLPPGHRRRLTLRTAARAASTAYAVPLDHRTMPTGHAVARLAARSGSGSRSSTPSGARRTWRSRSRSRRSRRSSWPRSASASPALLLLGWVALRHPEALARPTRRELLDTTIVGALLLGGGMGMVAWGEQTIPSGIAALLIGMMPVWVAVLGRLVLGERLPRPGRSWASWSGSSASRSSSARQRSAPAGALPAAGLARDPDLADRVVIRFAVRDPSGAPAASPTRRDRAADGRGCRGPPAHGDGVGRAGAVRPGRRVGAASLAAFLYLTVVGSLVAFTTYGWMIRVAPLPLVATYAYVNPVVAVILGALILSEPIEPRTLVAGAVIVAAVALIVTARGRMTPPTGREPRSRFRQDRPSHSPRQRHHGQHRVDPDRRREQRAIGDVQAGDQPVRAVAGADAAVRIARVVAGRRAHPDRAHLVRREDRPAVGRVSPSWRRDPRTARMRQRRSRASCGPA